MKKLSIMLIGLLLLLLVFGCVQNSTSANQDKNSFVQNQPTSGIGSSHPQEYVGNWDSGQDISFTFNSDGTGINYAGPDSNPKQNVVPFNWSAENGILTLDMHYVPNTHNILHWNYKFVDSNTLIAGSLTLKRTN